MSCFFRTLHLRRSGAPEGILLSEARASCGAFTCKQTETDVSYRAPPYLSAWPLICLRRSGFVSRRHVKSYEPEV
ncbi:hypothetical protein FQA47_017630 [Oryzias melastigma]|uniref:Uncharacterized protein n=1 Tax=Oryzias melastigma TaxID=30732 RepID=A0A834KYP5_ORYME|nr:hypothetical protein FQA47_017630 [Oryzias melastigma]